MSKSMFIKFYAISIVIFVMFLLLPLTSTVSAQDEPVIFYSPQGNDVSVKTMIIITFRERMLQDETKNAFSIDPITPGDFKWNDRNLTFTPDFDLKEGEIYIIKISTNAKKINGVNIAENFSWSFKTKIDENVKNSNDNNGGGIYTWDFWEPIVTGITVIGTVLFALYGVWRLRKRRSKLKDYITRLDDVYDKYRKDPYVCEHKLSQLKESLKIKFKSGEMEENHYLIMDKKIDDYMTNIRYRKKLAKPKIIGGPEGEIREVLEKQLKDESELDENEIDKDIAKERPARKSKKKPPRPKIIPD